MILSCFQRMFNWVHTAPYLSDFPSKSMFTRILGGVCGSGKSLWVVVSFSFNNMLLGVTGGKYNIYFHTFYFQTFYFGFYFNNMLLGVTGGKYKDIRLGPASSRVDKKPAVADGQMARYYWPGQRGHIARICYPRRRLIFYPFATSWFVASRYFSLSWFIRPSTDIFLCSSSSAQLKLAAWSQNENGFI